MKPSARARAMTLLVFALSCASVAAPLAQGGVGDLRAAAIGLDPGCSSRTLVSMGGAAPKNPQTLAIRWIGHSNFELAYNGQIILLDAYYDRNPRFPSLGFKAAEVKRADLMLIGHGHVDHMSDAASVGGRTGALVVGAPATTEKLLTQSIDPKQVKTVTGKGGEVLQFKGYKVEAILGRHGEPDPSVVAAFNQAIRTSLPPLTPEQQAAAAEIGRRGTGDARIRAEGSIAYLITTDNGFRIMYRDTGGLVTDYEKAAMQRIGGRVDVALAATAASFIPSLTTQRALEFMRAYKPDVFMPAHHDDDIWRPTESLFQALKEENPNLMTVSKVYREPTCFNTEDNIQRRQNRAR